MPMPGLTARDPPIDGPSKIPSISRPIRIAAASGAHCSSLIETSQARGFRQMIAVIGDSTKQAVSVGLHVAVGFRHVGILQDVGFKHGRWLDSVLMQRALGPGATEPP